MSMLNQQRLLGQLERRIRELQLPLGITWWDGRTITPAGNARVNVTVRSPRALTALLKPTMGVLARHYVEEHLDVDGDTREITHIGEVLSGTPQGGQTKLPPFKRWLRHSRVFDRKAIQHHYDVGDDFFGLWLDPLRVYSCAYFRRADDTLEIAQEQKLDHICRKLMLRRGERLLDIGCGWGALIMWAAKHYGVHAFGITLSQNQYEYARARIKEAGLEGTCEVRLIDYRDVPEDKPYDKIASVGMFEHVGRKNLPVYFAKIRKLLKPAGLVMNHGITLNAPGRDSIGSDIGDFIDEYVFPGGELTHISEVIGEMAAQGLESWDVENLRPHYAKTLWHWVDNLEANRQAAIAKVGEKIYRVWRIYMAGSAHAFERGWLSIYQVVATPSAAQGHVSVPLTREHLYAR
jgi:cyclopropane-fatty-acyl-phospholipid synthase